MNTVAIRSGSLLTALALSAAVGAHDITVATASDNVGVPASAIGTGYDDPGLKLYIADPELGLSGRYRDDNGVIYFEARRNLDGSADSRGTLTVRLLDGEALLLAQAGSNDGDALDGPTPPAPRSDTNVRLLAALADALDGLQVHAALATERSIVAGLATIGGRSALVFPYTMALPRAADELIDPATMADFYLGSLNDLHMLRDSGGVLRVDLGFGLGFESNTSFLPHEADVDGQMGRFDVYSRVVNGHGEHLTSELGGDHAPAHWNLHSETETRERSHDEIAGEAGRAAMALNAMSVVGRNSRGVSFGTDLEQAAMYRLARSLTADLLPISDLRMVSDEMGRSTGRYRTNLQIHRKSLVVIAEHSATRLLRYYYTSTTSNVISSSSTVNYCNHGTCPGGSGMSRKCTYTGPRLGNYRTPPKHGGDGTCNTAYSLAGDSTAPIWNLWYNHNCHDDSSVQLRVVKGQSYGVRSGRCADGPLFWGHAPNC